MIPRYEPLAAVNADGRAWREVVTADDELVAWTFDDGPQPVPTVVHAGAVSSAAPIDTDGDGREELAALTLDPPLLRLFRYGDQGWSSLVALPAPSEGALVSIDHGADGDADILLVTAAETRLYVNRGNDEFTDEGSIAAGGGARHWVGQVDDNGLVDLLRRHGADSVRTYLQQPDGSYVQGPMFSFGAVGAGDLTGDGLVDLVGDGNPVRWAPSLGDGTFGDPEPLIEEDVYARELTDLDGDGALDVLAYDATADEIISFLRQGDDYVRHPGGMPPLDDPTFMADVSADGINDYIGLEGAKTAIVRADGSGGFHAPAQAQAFEVVRRIVPSDLDGDGDPDLVAVGDGAVDGLDPGLVLLRNTGGKPTFWTAQEFEGDVYEAPVVDDLDGDADPDIAVWSGEEIVMVENTPDGMFSVRRSLPVTNAYFAHRIFSSDLDGNGLLDFVVVDELTAFRAYLNQGGWEFAPLAVETAHPYPLDVIDATGDGLADVVLRSGNDAPTPEIAVLPGRGDGTFTTPIVSQIALEYAWGYHGDFDGDGDLDLLGVAFSQISLLRNDGAGRFEDLGIVAEYYMPRGIGVADFDLDGLDDFLAGSQAGYSADMRLSRGDGTFSEAIPIFAPAAVVTMAPVDMDSDHELDIVIASNPSRGASVITAVFSRCPSPCPSDLTHDGRSDTRDLIAFLQLWASGASEADWNHDGLVNTLDVTAFLDEWADGCP